jgi:hypothetical protein
MCIESPLERIIGLLTGDPQSPENAETRRRLQDPNSDEAAVLRTIRSDLKRLGLAGDRNSESTDNGVRKE